MTFCTFEDSVLDHADHHGNLSHGDAQALLAQHGFTLSDWLTDCEARGWQQRTQDAQTLLAWLGY